MKIRKLNVDEAIEILNALGSEDDPIIFRGKEETPTNLSDMGCLIRGRDLLNYEISASDIRIMFFAKKRKRKIKGSLYSMVVCRLTER